MRKMMFVIFLMVFAIMLFSCGKNSLGKTDNDADINESEIEDTDNFESIKWSDLSDKHLISDKPLIIVFLSVRNCLTLMN